MSFQVHDSERPPLQVVSNSLTVNFLVGVKENDWLEAHCTLDRKGKRTAYASGSIRRGDEVVMTMTGVYAIIR
jgi:acyl-coenzyme A thioesterase PaaI-like protein